MDELVLTTGTSGNDRLEGDTRDDQIVGGDGNDTLVATENADTLLDARNYTRVSGPDLPLFEDSWSVQVTFTLPPETSDIQRLIAKPVGGAQTFSLLLLDGIDQVRFDKVGGGAETRGSFFDIYNSVDVGDTITMTGIFDADAGLLTANVTGSGIVSSNVFSANPVTAPGDIFIGRFSDTVTQTFDGEILEARVWSRAISIGELRTPPSPDDPTLEIDLIFEDGVPTDRATRGHTVTYVDLADDDQLFGGAGNDSLFGGNGDDLLHGGTGEITGFNLLEGGLGNDTASYAIAVPGLDGGALEFSGIMSVFADLQISAANLFETADLSGYLGRDQFDSIENLIGAAGNDVLLGDGADNHIDGGLGNDSIDGRGGNDTIVVEKNDTAEGGAGNDTFIIRTEGAATIIGGDIEESGTGDIIDFTEIEANGGIARYDPNTGEYRIDYLERQVFWLTTIEGSFANSARTIDGVRLTPQDVLEANPEFANSPDDFTRVVPDDPDFEIQPGGLLIRQTTGTFDGIETFIGGEAVVFEPTEGDDNLVGTLAFDTLNGLGGDDTIDGRSAADVLDGGDGDDSIIGGSENDQLSGGAGNDTIDGGGGSNRQTDGLNTIFGGAGDDHLTGGFSNDTIEGGTGKDSINSEGRNDLISGGTQNDTIRAGDGDDTVRGDNGRDLTFLGRGNDLFQDNMQNDQFGGDTVFGGSGGDTINGAGGADVLHGNEGNDSMLGGIGADRIFGGTQNDTIRSGRGDDTVQAGNGRDLVFLDSGNDLFNDSSQNDAFGRDTVFGAEGSDTLNGGGGADVLHGNTGADSILGGLGADRIFGGTQDDTIRSGAGNDVVRAGNGRDLVFLGDGNDLFSDTAQNDSFGADTVFGGLGNDTINGGGGADVIHGQQGADVLRGGLRDDQIFGGIGDDTLTGGGGADAFVFMANGGQDVVTDFALGLDTIEIASAVVGGRSEAQVVISFASLTLNGVLLDFQNGQTILLEGVTTTLGLATDIEVF